MRAHAASESYWTRLGIMTSSVDMRFRTHLEVRYSPFNDPEGRNALKELSGEIPVSVDLLQVAQA
jgi:hypothetical protein